MEQLTEEQILSMLPEGDAVDDAPDSRDFPHEDVFGSAISLPRRVVYDNTLSQDQNLPNVPTTKYACVFYTMTHITNEQNFLEWRDNPAWTEVQAFQEQSAALQAKQAYEAGLLTLNSGAFIQSGPKFAMKLGLTAGYTLLNSVEAMKQAIYERQLVQIATGKINWVATIRDNDNVIVPGKCYNHSMAVEGYDDDLHGGCFIIRNSLGEFGKYRGRHFLKYSDFDILFPSKYAYIDKSNQEMIDQYKAFVKIERVINAGFMTRTRMDDYATRFEAAIVINNIIPGATNFWKGSTPNNRCSRQEFIWMFQKASGIMWPGEIKRRMDYMTRREMAIWATTMHDLIISQKPAS